MSSVLKYTHVKDIKGHVDAVTAAFDSGKTRSIEWRKAQIKQLGFMVQDNEAAFIEAVRLDLNRPAFETITAELTPMKAECNEAFDCVSKWATPQSVKTSLLWFAASPKVAYEPKGAVLIIGVWNFPIALLLGPLLGAIAAGCSAIIKPGEQSANVAALMTRLIPAYLDNDAYRVVNGDIPQTTELLKYPYGHVFYTGSTMVGKIIARACAEHLTTMTLELGGKSPAVVFDDADFMTAARRILWSKFSNAGQICIAADYVVCSRAAKPKLIEAMHKVMKEFSPDHDSLLVNEEYSKIVTENHFTRLSKLLETTNGDIIIGGKASPDKNKIEVTVVDNVLPDDVLLQSEIFGPILPIMTMESKEEIARYIAKRDNPLALYVFTSSDSNADYIRNNTRSGSIMRSDTLVQFLIPGLPFGGSGDSGQGNYHGKASFDTFSHQRAMATVPTWFEPLLASRYPPYSAKKLWMMNLASGATVKGRVGPKPNL